jgi:glutamate synthase (NADPH/NADH) small chain
MAETNLDQGFEEKLDGYTEYQAIVESSRCLMCDDAPCQDGCPANVRVADFLRRIRTGDFLGAAKIIREDNVFGASCARICPSERLCQLHCSNKKKEVPVDIPGLQKFVCDYQQKMGLQVLDKPVENGKKIAVIGAGPGGLAAAFEFRKLGYNVTVYEAEDIAGGLLRTGIPTYRLNRDTLNCEIDFIIDYGVNIVFNKRIESIEELKQCHDAIYISIGMEKEIEVNIPGNDLSGVYYALDFLKKKYIEGNVSVGKRIAVIGGGDVAMDCARTAIRLPGVQDVFVIYRRSAKEMPAQDAEIDLAQREGVMFQNLLAPAAIEGKGKVEKLICQQVELGDPDESGRRKPIVQKDTSVEFYVDNIIFAIGQRADKDFYEKNPELSPDERSRIKINPDTYETSIPDVYAGGDVVGGSTAVESIGNAKVAVHAIHDKLSRGN